MGSTILQYRLEDNLNGRARSHRYRDTAFNLADGSGISFSMSPEFTKRAGTDRSEAHSMDRIYGAIEAGGTKFVCAVGSSPEQIEAETWIPTTTPAETLDSVAQFLRPFQAKLAAIGIAVANEWPQTKFPHAGHVLLSTWASLFHITMALGHETTLSTMIVILAFLFL